MRATLEGMWQFVWILWLQPATAIGRVVQTACGVATERPALHPWDGQATDAGHWKLQHDSDGTVFQDLNAAFADPQPCRSKQSHGLRIGFTLQFKHAFGELLGSRLG